MAHNLNYNHKSQQHSFFSVKEKAWHGLGTILEDYPTSAEAIKFAGLDFSVEKRPLYSLDNQNFNNFSQQLSVEPNVPVTNYFANLRTDTQEVLGVVGKDYQIVQNRDAFSFFDSIVDGNQGIRYETAGALGKGERIFITAKLPDYIRVGKDDLIEQYIFLTTSHDGYGSITAAFTPVRIVCQNTLNAAMRTGQNSLKIRHTASAVDRLKQAHQLMGITSKLAIEMEELYNQWSKIRIRDKDVRKLIEIAMAPGKETIKSLQEEKYNQLSTHYLNIVEHVCEYAQSAPSQQTDTTKGTIFGVYNAVTGYFQNIRKFPNEENKLKSIIYGTGLQRAQTTFDLCHQFAKTGSFN